MLLWISLVTGALANTESCLIDYAGPKQDGILPNTEYRGLGSWAQPVAEPGRYFAKVCWPASQPADLGVEFNGTHLLIESDSSTVEFTVLMSTFKWGIPVDVLGIIPYIILALCTGFCLVFGGLI